VGTDRAELDQPGTVGVGGTHAACGFHRQPGLAHAAGAGQRHQAMRGQQLGDLGDAGRATDEVGQRDREVAGNGPHAGRGELWVVAQDRQVEFGQLGTRVDTEFLDQLIAELPVARQRLALASGPVEGTHVGTPQALPKRV
jgi:hypothetical protein